MNGVSSCGLQPAGTMIRRGGTMRACLQILVAATVLLVPGSAVLSHRTMCDEHFCTCEPHGKIVCACTEPGQEVLLTWTGQTQLRQDSIHVVVRDCGRVTVVENAFRDLRRLQTVQLSNIGSLTLQHEAFHCNRTQHMETTSLLKMSIDISDSDIPDIPSFAFKGCLKSVTLKRVNVSTVSAFAFASLHDDMEKIEFVDCQIDHFESQAFKKFSVHSFYVTGGYFKGNVPSRTMVDLEVHHNLHIKRVTIDNLFSSAVLIRGPKTFRLEDCIVKRMEGEALNIRVNGPVTIKNNTFLSLATGAFVAISDGRIGVDFINSNNNQNNRPFEFTFENNTVVNFTNGSLIFNVSGIDPRIFGVFVNQGCDCNSLETWRSQLTSYPPHLLIKRNGQLADVSSPYYNVFWCRNDIHNTSSATKHSQYTTFLDYQHEYCGFTNIASSRLFVSLIVTISLLLVVVVVVVVVVVLCRRRRARTNKKWINVPNNEAEEKFTKIDTTGRRGISKKDSKSKANKSLKIVIPDGRTYRETELHVIVERAEPIAEREYVAQNAGSNK